MKNKFFKLLAVSLAILLLPAMVLAQEYTPGPYVPPPPPPVDAQTPNIVYTTVNPPPPGTQWNWTGFINSNTTGGGYSGGNTPAYNPSNGTFYFGYAQGTVTYKLFDSIDLPDPGIQINGFKYSWEYLNQDYSRGTLTGNLKLLGENNSILENYNFNMPKPTSGWTLQSGQFDFNMPYDGADIFGIQLSFSGKDDRFWAGYYGPQIRGMDVSLLYTDGAPPPPPNFPYWNPLVNENGIFTLTEPTTVRYGAQGTYLYATFQPGTYACTNSDWGNDPIGGVYKSCEAGSNSPPPPPPSTVDCTVSPTDPNCAVLVYTDPKTIASSVAETSVASTSSTPTTETTTSTTASVSSEPTATTEIVANTGSSSIESFSEKEKVASDPVLAASVASEAVANAATAQATNPLASTPGSQAAYRELSDEEKAAILADAIAKNVIEGALTTIAATSAASASNGSQDGSTSTTTVRREATVDNSVDNNSVMVAENNQSAQTENQDTNGGLEILETGRVKAQESIAATMAATENSANESISQAEAIASNSSAASYTVNNVDEVMANATASSNSVENKTADVAAAESVAQAEAIALASIEASKPTQSAFEDTSNADADLVNTMIDPALAMSTAMNTIPNVMNLEILGVIGNNKPEEKSDAEKRADQIVAANQQQMEEINKNYMEADQSGIIGAIGADGADVRAYRTAMLSDAAQWYKDKDIYKGIIIKDNVRGSYFLEKGNTDTYKRMVDEQYR